MTKVVAESLDQYIVEKKKEKKEDSSFYKSGKASHKVFKKAMKKDPKPDIHFPDKAAIQFAKGAGHKEIVKALKKKKVNEGQNFETLLVGDRVRLPAIPEEGISEEIGEILDIDKEHGVAMVSVDPEYRILDDESFDDLLREVPLDDESLIKIDR